jgi:sec-independent protein translocase protein TatA
MIWWSLAATPSANSATGATEHVVTRLEPRPEGAERRRGAGCTVAHMDIGPQELLILAIVLLVVFGGSQIPKLAKNLGSAQAEFKKGLAEASAASKQATAATPAAATTTTAATDADQPTTTS